MRMNLAIVALVAAVSFAGTSAVQARGGGSGGGSHNAGANVHAASPSAAGAKKSGSGAGKVTFNPFSITRKVDRSSP
jgi:hypothetical protein